MCGQRVPRGPCLRRDSDERGVVQLEERVRAGEGFEEGAGRGLVEEGEGFDGGAGGGGEGLEGGGRLGGEGALDGVGGDAVGDPEPAAGGAAEVAAAPAFG